MILQSMTDFVLEHPATTDYEWQLSRHLNYANFLQQPITLGMFIPCDEEGNVLELPKNCNVPCSPSDWHEGSKCAECRREVYAWDEAKERVLFEGFELVFDDKVRSTLSNAVFHVSDYANIDTLSICWGDIIELTHSALRQIGLTRLEELTIKHKE